MDSEPDRPTDPFAEFYLKHHWWVSHTAGRFVGARDAEDVAQEVFVSVALAHERGHFDLTQPALAYLRVATCRAARAHLRRLLREQPAPHDEEIDPMDETLHGDPARAMAVRRQWDELDGLLETLPPERRMVWVMAELLKMTLVEIAEAMETSPNTVNKRLKLAREDFAAALARKRAAEKRKLAGAASLLLLPLDADAVVRMARTLPPPEVSTSVRERVWRRIQRELAIRREYEHGALGKRLKSEASHVTTLVLGTVVGLLAAMALADTHPKRMQSETVAQPSGSVAPSPVAVVPPAVVDSVGVAPMASIDEPLPPPGPTNPELTEVTLLKWTEEALAPPNPDPQRALRLLDRYAEAYPESRRFASLAARLRLEARHLAEQKR